MGDLSRLKLNSRTIQEYLDGAGGVDSQLHQRAESALSSAQSTAPVATGAYRDSLHIEEDHTDRLVVRVVADVPYAMIVEADHGTLARALGAAG